MSAVVDFLKREAINKKSEIFVINSACNCIGEFVRAFWLEVDEPKELIQEIINIFFSDNNFGKKSIGLMLFDFVI